MQNPYDKKVATDSLKVERTKFSGLDGKTKVRFNLTPDDYVEADSTGVLVCGRINLTTMTELRDFAKIVSDAWKDVEAFRRGQKITSTLSGH